MEFPIYCPHPPLHSKILFIFKRIISENVWKDQAALNISTFYYILTL